MPSGPNGRSQSIAAVACENLTGRSWPSQGKSHFNFLAVNRSSGRDLRGKFRRHRQRRLLAGNTYPAVTWKRPLRDFLSTRPSFKSGRQAGSFSLIKTYRCAWSFSFCLWIALLAVVLCWTGTEQTVIPLTGLVQRTYALGHAINRSGGPQSFVVTARVRRINPFP